MRQTRDSDERLIAEAFTHTAVEAPDLAKRVRAELHRPAEQTKPHTRLRTGLLVAIAAVIVLSTSALAVYYSSFQRLMDEVNPEFAGYLEEVEEAYADQGICMELVAYSYYENRLVAYVTLEDTQGLGRVNDQLLSHMDQVSVSGSGSYGWSMTHYDEETGILTYQLTADYVGGREVTVTMRDLYYAPVSYEGHDTQVDLSAVSTCPDTTLISNEGELLLSILRSKKWNEIMQSEKWNEIEGSADLDGVAWPILTPGVMDLEIPGVRNVRITNLGFVEGKLRIQVWRDYEDNGTVYQFYLQDAQGKRIDGEAVYSYNLEDGRVVEWSNCYWEYEFEVSAEDAAQYRLLCDVTESPVVKGAWSVTIPITQADVDLVSVDCSFQLDHLAVERAAVTPFGLALYGRWTEEGGLSDFYSAVLDCGGELVTIGYPSYRQTGGDADQPYAGEVPASSDDSAAAVVYWYADTPIDVTSVRGFTVSGHEVTFP